MLAFDAHVQALAERIYAAPEGISHSVLMRNAHLPAERFRLALSWLIDRGLIQATRPATNHGGYAKHYQKIAEKTLDDVFLAIQEGKRDGTLAVLSYREAASEEKSLAVQQAKRDMKRADQSDWKTQVETESQCLKDYQAKDVLIRVWALANGAKKEETRLKALMHLGQAFRLWEGDTTAQVTKFVIRLPDGSEGTDLREVFQRRVEELEGGNHQ